MYFVALPVEELSVIPIVIMVSAVVLSIIILLNCRAGSIMTNIMVFVVLFAILGLALVVHKTNSTNREIQAYNKQVQWFNDCELELSSEYDKIVPNGARFEYVMKEFVDGKYIVTFKGTDKTDDGSFFVDGYIKIEVPEEASEFDFERTKFKTVSDNSKYVSRNHKVNTPGVQIET